MRSFIAAILVVSCGYATASGNMNGEYIVSSVDKTNVPFNDDFASKGHEYFDVWAPEIATHYGEVFWTSQGNQPLPAHIVERFKGKVIAITGYEQDQVMVVPTGKPGLNPDQDVSVPINWAYNHHYMAWMTGVHSEMKEVRITDEDELWRNHGKPTKMVAVDIPESVSGVPRKFGDVAPTNQLFSEGNGGESRKSFHGYPSGFAQLIESPTEWHITPMQIDTRNRDCGSTYKDVNNCTNFTAHASYEPRQSRYNRDWQGVDKPHLPSPYSGILECPCNSRYGGDPMVYGPNSTTKIITHQYATIPSGTCGGGKDITNAVECFDVASTLGIEASSVTNKSVSDATFPGGCSVTANKDGTATVTYNTELATPCSRAPFHVGEASTNANVTLHISLQANTSSKPWMKKQAEGEWCSDNQVNVLAKYPAASMSEADLEAALDKCNTFCLGSDKCNFCSADDLRAHGGSVVQYVAIPSCGNINHWEGSILGDVSAKVTDPKPTMFRHKKGQYCMDNHQGVLAKFVAASLSSADVAKALSQCEDYCINVDTCNFCSVDKLTNTVQFVAIPACGTIESWDGTMVGDVSEKTTASSGTATITISGPADVWFGVGLDAQKMSDSPYVIYANSSGAFEQQIGTCGSEAEHCPGNPLAPSITLESNSVVSGVRTVVVTRPFKGLTNKHYSFRPDNVNTLNFISASGSSQTFAYHRLHDPAVISFASPGVPVCVCDEGHSGQLCTDDGHCGSFTKRCLSHDQGGDLLTQRNPTCNSIQYAGGLSCCGHRRIMLDADQEVRPELLRYHMKFRFWFQEYVPANASSSPKGTTRPTTASHYNLPRIYFQTEANAGEYDIPPAFATEQYPLIPGYPNYPLHKPTPGTTCTGTCPGDDCECVHTITFNHTVSNMRLIYAGGHCHAPSCIGIWLYRNDPGHEMELLCHQRTMYGKGNVTHDKYDETGYVTLPPCLWGEDEGLEPSVLLPPNTELVSIKKNRNTDMGHYGEMASWQMRGVSF